MHPAAYTAILARAKTVAYATLFSSKGFSMADFAEWLASQKDNNPDLKRLQEFARQNAGDWDAAARADLGAYQANIAAKAPDDSRNPTLTALGQYYERWKHDSQRGFGSRVGGLIAGNIGIV